MTVAELLGQLSEKNVALSVKGDDLVVRGGERVLETPELLELLRKNKKALVEHIKAGRYVDPKGIVQVPPNRIPPACEAITPEMLPLVKLTQPEIDSVVVRVPGGAPNVQDIYPLAPLQEGMLFHHLIAKEGDVYLTHSLLAFDTRARLDRVLRVLQEIIDRHDILRTAVLWEGLPEPVQVVWRRAPLVVEEVSLEPTGRDVAEELSARFDPRRYRLDVHHAPLMRVYIAHDARKNRWVMLHLFHHLAVDHVTHDILLEEIQAHLQGRAEQLPPSLPFRNFVAQARLGVSRQEHEEFFRRMLGDVDEPTAPYGLIDVQGDGSGIREAGIEVEAGLAVRLRQRARALGVSAASLCHLAWAVVLGRVSGRENVVFGTVLFGRMQGVEGADRAMGMLINTLPIRICVGEQGVEEGVRQAYQSLTELMRHEHAPLALAQRCSGVEAPMPLFSALLNYRYGAALIEVDAEYERAWEGVALLGSEERANYPFGLSVDDLGEGLALNAQVQSPVEPDRICAYMHTALERLVEALEEAPTTPVRNLDVLPEPERDQLLVKWNETEREYGESRSVAEMIADQAMRRGDAIAVVSEQGAVSYRELNRRANQLSNYLGSRGIGKEDLVGICAERSVEMMVAILGSLKAGAAYVPIDPADPVQRMEGKMEDAQLKLMLTQEGLLGRIGNQEQEIVCLDKNWDEIERYSGANPDNEIDGDELAYVIYTSGSTGRPKGVPISHRNLVRSTQARLAYYNEPISNYLLLPSFAFDSSVAGIFWTLCVGATLTLPPENYHQDLEGLISLISRDYVSHTLSVPSLYSHLLDALGERGFGSLRCVIVAGEASPPALADRHREMLPGAVLFNEYGPTEGTVWSTVYDCSEHPPMTQIPIGRPIPGMQSYILDSRLEPTPVGVSGEIYIGGEGVARGYVRRPELTAERFVPNRYGKRVGERLYRTGDVGRYLSDGNIEYLGRADDQVKVRGYRIELGEIQAALEEHGSVKQSVVVAREDERGRKRLLGYVVGEEGTTAAELKMRLRERLPEYMVPEAILMLEEMPLTMNGKIDRRRLPIVEGMGGQVEQEYVAPRTPVEETLVGIFEEVLKLDRVGIHDNFFEIGGHSLLVTQVISRVRSTFEVAIDVNSIFEAETVAKLAEMLIAREPKPGQTEKIAMILTKLSNMTDEDVEAELAALERQVANEGIDGDTNERF